LVEFRDVRGGFEEEVENKARMESGALQVPLYCCKQRKFMQELVGQSPSEKGPGR